jgi:glycosyltransferase involved in cell wall biosynthesis
MPAPTDRLGILHVEGGRHLHGGAFQVLRLIEGLSARGHRNLLVCPRGCALAAAARPHAEVWDMPMGGDGDVRILWRLLRVIRATEPDLVHLHSRIGADLWGGLAARLARVAVIHTRRVDNPEPRWVVALKYRLHSRVIAISEAIARVLRSEGLPARKLRVVRSAVDWQRWAHPCDRSRLAERLDVPADALLIGVVAQLIARKGHRFLIAALPHIVAAHRNLHVVFFGRGPLEGELRAAATAAGLEGVVHFAGFRGDLEELLGGFDLLVHPATMEGLGVALLQAASAAVPIVASAVGGIPEAVRPGENGVLVPPGDVQALGEAIDALLADPRRRIALGQGGQRLMAREFSVDAMVEGNLAVYRELLNARNLRGKGSRP